MGYEKNNTSGNEASIPSPIRRPIIEASNDILGVSQPKRIQVFMRGRDYSGSENATTHRLTPHIHTGRTHNRLLAEKRDLKEAVFLGRARADTSIRGATERGKTNYSLALFNATVIGEVESAYARTPLSPTDTDVPLVVEKLARAREASLGRIIRYVLDDHPQQNSSPEDRIIRLNALAALTTAAGLQIHTVNFEPDNTKPATSEDFVQAGWVLENIKDRNPDDVPEGAIWYLRVHGFRLSEAEERTGWRASLANAENASGLRHSVASHLEFTVAGAVIFKESVVSLADNLRMDFILRRENLRLHRAMKKLRDAYRTGDDSKTEKAHVNYLDANERVRVALKSRNYRTKKLE